MQDDQGTQNISGISDEKLVRSSREYFADGYHWFDLIRTQKWTELASSYEICGSGYGDHTAVMVTRDIQPYHYLRPMPQGQFDGMEMTAAEKDAYQNPGASFLIKITPATSSSHLTNLNLLKSGSFYWLFDYFT